LSRKIVCVTIRITPLAPRLRRCRRDLKPPESMPPETPPPETPPSETPPSETPSSLAPAEEAATLQVLLAGARIQDIRQPRDSDLVLETYRPADGTARWLLSASPHGARFVRTFAGARTTPTPGTFLQWLRTRLVGGRIRAAAWLASQAVDLAIEHAGQSLHLLLEVNGKDSNLLLLDGERRLLMALRRPALPDRPLALGEPYVPPPHPRRLAAGEPSRLPLPGEAAARALDALWRGREAERLFQDERRAALRRAKAQVGRLQRRLDKVRGDLDATGAAETLRLWGELLKIHAGTVRPGMAEVRVTNEFLPDRPLVTIPLDPRANAAENIAALFRRYRKGRDAAAHVERRLRETQAELDAWRALEAALAEAPGAEALAALLAAQPAARRAVLSPAPAPRGDRPAPKEVMSRVSSDGLTIFIGRSKLENDEVTFRIGRGRDWWFHVLGWPGAHVLVRAAGEGPLPPATQREAAWLAAYYSQGRQQGGLEVACTQRKHVRKVKGGESGQVTHSQGRTLWVDLADPAARSVLDVREEE
jgi:predicted ribosome quality control (RQC) complex YloA/Tae2 family protein